MVVQSPGCQLEEKGQFLLAESQIGAHSIFPTQIRANSKFSLKAHVWLRELNSKTQTL